MVVFVLYVKADLGGVDSVSLVHGTNLCISVRNPLNDYEIREKVVIEASVLEEQEPKHPNDHSHREPVCHFAVKWEGATERSTIQVLGKTEDEAAAATRRTSKKGISKARSHSTSLVTTRDMTAQDSGEFVPMLSLECHGVEPYAFHPMSGEFNVTNKAGVKFDGADLSAGTWSEFDLGSGTTSISNLEFKFM
jgi:hypothetical protein